MTRRASNSKALAAKDYKPGDEIVFVERPMVHAVESDFKFLFCDSCLREESEETPLKRCSRCRSMAYCSQKCQLYDWTQAGHKLECRIFKVARPFASDTDASPFRSYTLRMTLRLWLLAQSDPSYLTTRRWTLHDGSERSFGDLVSNIEHYDLVRSSASRANFSSAWICGRLSDIYPNMSYSEEIHEQLMEIYTRILTNNNGMGSGEKPISSGLFMELTPFNHSCLPNTFASSDGLSMSLRVIHPIKAGEEITFDYVDPINSTEFRQSQLNNWPYYFECTCPRCTSTRSEPPMMRFMAQFMSMQDVNTRCQNDDYKSVRDLDEMAETCEESILFLQKILAPLRYHRSIQSHLKTLILVTVARLRLCALKQDKRRIPDSMEKIAKVRDRLIDQMMVVRGRNHSDYSIVMRMLRSLGLQP